VARWISTLSWFNFLYLRVLLSSKQKTSPYNFSERENRTYEEKFFFLSLTGKWL
jgi:hypothetical protein